jgi:hypothetical protein
MTRFDRNGLRAALASGICDPPRALGRLLDLSRQAYRKLEDAQGTKTLRYHYTRSAERMTSAAFGQMRVGVDRAVKAAPEYFPAYAFHVGELINDEWLATVDWHEDFHRDHISHQLMCVYVGQTLLCGGDGEFILGEPKRPLLDWCLDAVLQAPECEYLREYLMAMGAPKTYGRRDAVGRRLWRQLFMESFFLACMYHDIGYPWQFVHKIGDKLHPHAPGGDLLTRGVDAIYDHYKHRLVMYPFNGYQPYEATQPGEWTKRARSGVDAGFTHTHGVPGAFAFLYLNDILREYPRRAHSKAVSRFCIEWAAVAIAMHDLQKLYAGKRGLEPQPHLRVVFQRDPLSFMLTLTDQLQDFGRPNAVFSRSGHVTLTYTAACHRVEVRPGPKSDELTAWFYYGDKESARKNILECKPDAEDEYFHPKRGFLSSRGVPLPRIRLKPVYEAGGSWWPAP